MPPTYTYLQDIFIASLMLSPLLKPQLTQSLVGGGRGCPHHLFLPWESTASVRIEL